MKEYRIAVEKESMQKHLEKLLKNGNYSWDAKNTDTKQVHENNEVLERMVKTLEGWDFGLIQEVQDSLVVVSQLEADNDKDADDLLTAYRLLMDFRELKHLALYVNELGEKRE